MTLHLLEYCAHLTIDNATPFSPNHRHPATQPLPSTVTFDRKNESEKAHQNQQMTKRAHLLQG